ncbi:MAG: flagellar hook-length control protein FliK [Bacteroides sp.]|nr:flagellar hook-length control protein FliK [Prevotella sp.]MCM1407405.1 flagellar hook-length control protein FliK [Treponema brennaborense]MCM1469895.1 flagellar hook-length control protein FliK [Bacteroides sp.]
MQTSSIRMEQPAKLNAPVNPISRRAANDAVSDVPFYEKLQAVQKEYETAKTDSPSTARNAQQDNIAAEAKYGAPSDENREILNENEVQAAELPVSDGKPRRETDGTRNSVYAFFAADEAAPASESTAVFDASVFPAADDEAEKYDAVFSVRALNNDDTAAETLAADAPRFSEEPKNVFSKKHNDKKNASAKDGQEISADSELLAAAYRFAEQEIPAGSGFAALPADADVSGGRIVSGKKAPAKDALITVRDERTSAPQLHAETEIVRADGAQQTEIEMHLAAENGGSKTLFALDGSSHARTSSSAAPQFDSLLSRQIQAGADQFVRAGSIILKDNNRGTINLVLHPEELGNVKIQLELTDKVIAGKIIVSSEEAYNAFKANLQTIKDSFVSGGFADAGFDVSWGGSGAGGDAGASGENGSGQYHAKNMHGGKYSEAMGVVAAESGNDAGNYFRNASVNIVA